MITTAPARPARPQTRPPRRRTLLILREAVLWLVAAMGVASIGLFVVCTAAGVRPEIVVSGSMEPTLPTGSLVLAQPVPADQLAVGDVVSVERPEGRGLVTHRVVSVTDAAHGHRELTLKGDANATADPVTYTVAEAGRVVWSMPLVGAWLSMLKTPAGLGILAVALVALLLFAVRGSRRRQGPETTELS